MLILDDFENNNLINLLNYTSGASFVRNFVILEDNNTNEGSYIWSKVSPSSSNNVTAYFIVDNVYYSSGIVTSLEAIVSWVQNNATLIAAGIRAELLKDYYFDFYDTAWSKAIRFYTEENTAYTRITCIVTTTSSERFRTPLPQTTYVYDDLHLGGGTYFAFFSLMPEGDNQLIFAKDDDSILQYGKKIKIVTNNEMITSASNKQDLVDNELANFKDPRARCFVDMPFDYEQVTELDLVEVRLSYQNQGQFRTFKEGGHFKAWADIGTYRYKQFYAVGISHSKDGRYTRLRLMEKI